MTKAEFYEKLKASGIKFKIRFGCFIRTDSWECPICALYNSLNQVKLDSSLYGIAANKLGLSQEDANLIAQAADNTSRPDRDKLLEAFGL